MYSNSTIKRFKEDLGQLIISHLAPIQENVMALKEEDHYLNWVLGQGAEEANLIAEHNLTEIKYAMGIDSKE